jgi:hypothetical protein
MTTSSEGVVAPVGSTEPAGALPLLKAALRYARRGWPVFPVQSGAKVPLGRLVPHGLKDATRDPDQVAAWWTSEPQANIGLVTGVAFDVLDVDGDPGWTSLTRAVAERGCLSCSPVTRTPSGGAHFLFLPTGLGNRAGFLPSLDWRGRGGYVVAPPSIGPNGTYGWSVAPREQEIEAAPAWLVGLLEHKAPVHPVLSGAGGGSAYGRRALESELGRLALAVDGTRNHQLNASAHSLGQLVASGQLGAEEVVAALVAVGQRIGLSEKECEATVMSGMGAGMRSPRTVT